MSGDLKERIEKMLAADSLRAKGIKGTRDNGFSCPLANLIAREVPEAGHPDAMWDDSPGLWFVGLAYVRTPAGDIDTSPPIAEFIEVFDNGVGGTVFVDPEYPYRDLIEDDDDELAGAER